MNADAANQAAWAAYYRTLRDHPESTPAQRTNGEAMLKRKALYELAADDEEELA